MILLRLPLMLLLLIYQSAVLATGQIWSNKVRSMLTTIGIVIGVASVTAVIAALTGLRTYVLNNFEALGTNKIFIFPMSPGNNRNVSWDQIRLRPEHFEGLLDHCPSIANYTRINHMSEPISYNGRSEAEVDVQGIDTAWHKIENRAVIDGQPFSLTNEAKGQPVCLITRNTQEKLAIEADCIGRSLMIGTSRFQIIGLVEARVESGMFGRGGQRLEVFVPFGTVQRREPNSSVRVVAASRSPDVSEEAQAELTFFLRKRRRLGPTDPDNFQLQAVEQFVQQFKQTAQTITLAATGVVGISLLVGGVGIMNIMLVSVSERTREIGLRKAVGARPAAILLQFLVEAVVLCFLAGLLGVLLGQGLTSLMAKIPNANLGQAAVPGWAIALAFGFAGTVGLVFGMFPAIKAARLDPIEALRHE